MRRHALLLLLALLVSPAIAQLDEAGTYFQISTDRTYGTGDKPKVRLYGQGFQKLQFRVYRVNDPLEFFRQLEDPNQFGGQSHRPPQALTVLERWRRWKRQSRTALRNIVRRQYTAENRESIRDSFTRTAAAEAAPPARTGPVTEYANIPVLNQQQLVSTWEQPHRVANPWESSQVSIDVKERGVYLVEATDGKLQAYTIVCVSDVILLTKTGEGEILARVVDRKSGQPQKDVEVLGWLNRQEVLKARSDASGFVPVRTPALPKAAEGVDRSLMLLAHRGPDVGPVPVGEWQLRQSDPNQSVTAYAYTDRPVYRPGHEVHFRGILRRQRSLGWELPPAAAVNVVVEDPEGKPVVQRSLTPNANGTVHGDFTLSATAPLGYYSVGIRSGENYLGNTGFHVEEYRKPEYEVRVTPQAARVLQGDTVRATINARYYFGEPVPGAKVKYVVHRSRYWLPWYGEEEDAEEPSPDQMDEYLGNEQILEETGQLDANGKLDIQFASERAKNDLRYRIEARVTDEAGREISGTGWLIATRARFYVHAEPDKYVYQAGEKATIRVETKDYDGRPVGNLPFEVRLVRGKDQTVQTVSGRTGADGTGSASVTAQAGNLHAEVTAKDNDGRESSDTAYLWVGGGGWDWAREQRIDIIPDKKSYKAGDTAHLLLVTGVPKASVWVTVESRGIVSSRVVEAGGPTATFDVPIQPGFVPNIYVSATFVREGQSYQGMKSLRVPPVDQKLDVSVKPSKPQFKPGEKATYTVEAKNAKGDPVAAEFSLGIVDEAIYAIHRESVQDIASFFYGRRYSNVQTTSSLHYSFSGSSGKRRMQLTALRTARRAQIKPEKFVDPRVRKAFPDTIYWVADLRTGSNGRAEASLEFPDSLTTWRATARGITPDTRVGSAVDRTVVRKNLVLRLTAPRFFMQGDEMTVAAIVQNYLATDKTVRVSLDVKGLELIDGGTKDITVPARGVQQVFYRLKSSTVGDATLLGKALTDEESDALELTVPVKPYGVKQSQSRSGVLTEPTAAADAQLSFPAESNPASRTVEITVSPSVAGALFSALDYLVTFPYGCTEQTMSSFLPNVIVSQATKSLGIAAGLNEADLVRKTRAGIERLYSYQHDDGGWGWWQTDDSAPFMTAYVVAGLAQARDAGYQVKPDVLQKAVDWLKTELPKQKKQPDPDLRAYIAWALSLATPADNSYAGSVWEQRAKLSPYGTALLGLAVTDPTRKKQLAETLQSSVKTSDQDAYWEMKSDPLLEIATDTNAEATAFALKFLSSQSPDSPLLPKAAQYLMAHRDQGYYWSSTKQTAMVIFGLTDYLKATKELVPNFSATVSMKGVRLGQRQFTSPEPWTLRVPAESAAAVQISKSGPGRLYWTAQANFYNTADRIASTGSGSLAVTREYFRLTPEKKGDKVIYSLTPLADTPVEKGDLLAVRLVVKGSDWQYVVTEDPIPSGTEFVSRDDLYELSEKPKWWARWFSRREFHDDRMALFQQWMPRGESEQSYLLKVVNPGRFRIPPAHVGLMYQPGIFATSDSRTLEVRQ
jgi:uncharacterized protein YfaS (alpha-2-macroglobulin family)